MADFKEMNAEKFKEKLIGNFGNSGKVNILFDELVKINTEKNPFFYGIILNHIEKNSLDISDLVDSKSQVYFDKINVAIVQAKKEFEINQNMQNINNNHQLHDDQTKSMLPIEDKLKLIDFSNISLKDITLFANNISTSAKVLSVQQYQSMTKKVAEITSKYIDNKFVKQMKQLLDIYQYVEKGESIPQELRTKENLEFLEQKNICLDAQGKIKLDKNEKNVAESFNEKTGIKQYEQIIRIVASVEERNNLNEEEKRKAIKELMNVNPDVVEFLRKEGYTVDEIVNNKNYIKEINSQKIDVSVDLELIDEEVLNIHEIGGELSNIQIEGFFDEIFKEMQDPAKDLEQSTIEIKEKLGIEEIVEDELLGQSSTNAEISKKDAEEALEPTEEEHEPETFEHKTGLEKLLDKMKDSKNPVTKFLFNRIIAFQNRGNKRLDSSHKEIIPGEAKEKIDPVVKGNSTINSFFDRLLRRTTHREPENTIEATNPNKKENNVWEVSDDVKAKVDAVSGDAAKKASESKIIIPKEKNTQDKGNSEGPSFEDNL